MFPNCIFCSAYVSSKVCECISCSSQSVPFFGLTILIKVGHPWKYWPKSWIFGQIGQFVFRFCFGSGRENHFSWYINKLVNNSHTPHQILILCKINTYYLRCSIPPKSIHPLIAPRCNIHLRCFLWQFFFFLWVSISSLTMYCPKSGCTVIKVSDFRRTELKNYFFWRKLFWAEEQ